MDLASRSLTTLKDRHGAAHAVILTRDSEGLWLAQCRLPRQEPLACTSHKRRHAVGIVERHLIGGSAVRRAASPRRKWTVRP